MKKKLCILGLILTLGVGITYASAFIWKKANEDPVLHCYMDGKFYEIGESWTQEKDGKIYVFVCRSDGQIYCYELPPIPAQ